MQGISRRRSPRLTKVAVLFVPTLAAGAAAESIDGITEIRGKALFDNQSLARRICIRVVDAKVPRLSFGRGLLNENGEFVVSVRGKPGDEVVVCPCNTVPVPEGQPSIEPSVVYVGAARHTLGAQADVVLHLQAVEWTCVPLAIVDEDGEPERNIHVSCFVRLEMEKAEVYAASGRPKTDDAGILSLWHLRVGLGTYDVVVGYEDASSTLCFGRMSVSGEELLSSPQPRKLTVTKRRVSLLVEKQWDPDRPGDPSALYSAVKNRAIVLKGANGSNWIGRDEGRLAKFRNVPAGGYEIAFDNAGMARMYEITRESKFVNIPADAGIPVRHVVFIRPREIVAFSGKVVDSETGRPVEGVFVSGGMKNAVSDEEGKFAVEVPRMSEADLLVLERRGYYREKIAVGSKRAADTVTQCVLRPLPALEGRVVAGDAKLAVSGARLTFDSREMHEGFRCDEEGRFSLQLLPGDYRLRISVPAPAEEEEGATQKKPGERVRDSLVLSTDFTMPGESMTKEFLVPECVEVGIQIGFAPAMATPQKCDVLVLEAKSMRRITRALLQGGIRRFNLPEGRYKVAVVTEGMRGVVAGEISARKGDTEAKSLTVAKPWEACHVEDDEVVTFSPARDHRKTDGKDAQEH